jgi:ABC-type dipeptide/oligopeptide/nickel transport system permease component
MTTYILRRLIMLPFVLIGVTLLIFALLQMLSPFSRLAMFVTDPNQLKQGPEQLQEMVEALGLDDPVWVQYGRWLNQLLHGDLGWSESGRQPVIDAIRARIPGTLELALFAVIPVIFGGIWLGKLTAVHQNKPIDHGGRVVAIVGWSFPTFVLGLLALFVFYGILGWFPPGRLSIAASRIVNSDAFTAYTGLHTIDAILNGNWTVLSDALRHLVMPVITLAYLSWALIMRVMRSSMLEAMRQDYVTTARAKGLVERVVINKHAKRNALLPVTTIAGTMFAGLMGGVVITETVFNRPGLGRFAASAATQLDIPSVLGFALFNGILFVLMNLIVDLLYAYFDPRVRLE